MMISWKRKIRNCMYEYTGNSLCLDIPPYLTFNDMLSNCFDGMDFYDFIGVRDSYIRNQVFYVIANYLFHGEYEDVYELWENDRPLADYFKNCSHEQLKCINLIGLKSDYKKYILNELDESLHR